MRQLYHTLWAEYHRRRSDRNERFNGYWYLAGKHSERARRHGAWLKQHIPLLKEWPNYSEKLLEQEFARLREEWNTNVAFKSKLFDICTDPAYLRIIGLGPRVVPLILREMQQEPDMWFWALVSITGEDVAGDVPNMKDATNLWLAWGREHNLIG